MRQGSRNDKIAASQTAAAGVLNFLLTCAHLLESGIPLSRENAKIIRDVDVTQERPQNHWANVTIHRIMFPNLCPRAVWKMKMNGFESAAVLSRSLMASVTNASII